MDKALLQIITTEEELEEKLWSVLGKRPVFQLPPEVAELHKLLTRPSLAPQEVAKLYGVSVGTLANWRAQGKGPVFCQEEECGKVVYLRKDLDSYFESIRKITYA